MATEAQVLSDVLELMQQLADDWEYNGEISPDTYLLADLGFESLDLVVLGTLIQQRYGRLPFAELLAEIGRRPMEERDLAVGELVDYVCRHSSVNPPVHSSAEQSATGQSSTGSVGKG